jgi:nucleoside-diphosphate-sugar epimerase
VRREGSVLDLIAEIEGLTGTRAQVCFADSWPGEVRHLWATIDAARDQLGYLPLVSLREGLPRTIEHFSSGARATPRSFA